MYTVSLPPIEWFRFGNVYSGSLRPDPNGDALSQSVFHYTVKLRESNGAACLCAVCHFVLPWHQPTCMDEAMCGRFEVSTLGVESCQNWIRSKFLSPAPLPKPSEKHKKLCT